MLEPQQLTCLWFSFLFIHADSFSHNALTHLCQQISTLTIKATTNQGISCFKILSQSRFHFSKTVTSNHSLCNSISVRLELWFAAILSCQPKLMPILTAAYNEMRSLIGKKAKNSSKSVLGGIFEKSGVFPPFAGKCTIQQPLAKVPLDPL